MTAPDDGSAQKSAHPHEDGHDHDHDHGHHHHHHDDDDANDDGSPASTGFLPMSLAIALFVTGLFVLGLVPGVECG